MTYLKLSTESVGDAGDQYTGLDRFGRIVDQRWINGSNTDVDRYQYGYDRDGNRLYKDNKVIASLSEVYTYDSLNQLASYKLGTLNGTKTDVTGSPSNSQSWDYDAVGNWDSVTTNSTTQTRTANKQNEITAVSGATTPTYDSNGNLTTDENNYRFVYDAWNKVVQVKNSSNVVIVTYGRDALHRHVADTVGSTVTDRFFSSDWQLLETKVGSNTVTRNVWSRIYVDGLVLRDRDTDANGTLDERLYAMQDANWNTTALVNSSGTVQERYTYTPFGQVTFRDGSGSTLSASAKDWVFLHQGGERIAAGDFEFRNRVYSPSLGRWLTNDPLGFNARDQNWYRAIGNNPGNGLDPSGLAITAVDPIPDHNPLPERNPFGNMIDLPSVANDGYGALVGAFIGGLGEGAYNTFLDAPIKTGQFIIDVPLALNPKYQPMNPYFRNYLSGNSSYFETVFNITADAASVIPLLKGPRPKAPPRPSNGPLTSSHSPINYSMKEVRRNYWNGPAPYRNNPTFPKDIEYLELSHTYISQNGFIGRYIPDWIKNRGWNLNPLWGVEHALADPSRYGFMPAWWKKANLLDGPLERLINRMPENHIQLGGFFALNAERKTWVKEAK